MLRRKYSRLLTVAQKRLEQLEKSPTVLKFQSRLRPVESTLVSPLSVYLVAAIQKNSGQVLNLEVIAINNSQVTLEDLAKAQEVGLFIQPFARFSLN